MQERLLLGGMLTNIESWINISKQDIDSVEKLDTIIKRKILAASGNACRSFVMLELGIIPVRYVKIKKIIPFLHYILTKSTGLMIRQVFDVLIEDSR